MIHSPFGALSSLVPVLSIVGSLRAQEVAGALEGRVRGRAGVIEGAEVIANGPSLQGSRNTLTDSRGRFVLHGLPAGAYGITFRRIGYGPVRLTDVQVRLGATLSLGEILLEAQAVEVPEIVVSGARPVIDPISPATGATLDSSRFLTLPANRNYQALIPFVPQANVSPVSDNSDPYLVEGANIAGSSGLENAFYVDGANVTVFTGNSIDLPFNFVREIQIITGGSGAEYGRALSGVVNVVTPSGGNEFHGQMLGYFTSNGLRTPARSSPSTPEPVSFREYDVGLSLSGPIRRDRLWYFATYNPSFADQSVALAALPRQRVSELHHRLAAKLTWRPASGTDAAVTLLGDPYSHGRLANDPLLPILPSTTDPGAARRRETGGGWMVNAMVHQQFGARTDVSVAVSGLTRDLDQDSRSGSTSLQAITRINDHTTNTSSGGVGSFWHARVSRVAARIAVTRLEQRHTIKLGFEYEDNLHADTVTISSITRRSNQVYEWFVNQGFGRVHNRIPTFYAQDTWEVSPRLQVTAGLRWDAQYMSGERGPARTIGTELAPRFGVVYQPGKPGAQRLFGSAGRFFEQVSPLAVSLWNVTEGTALTREFPQNPLVDSSNGVLLSQIPYGRIPATAQLRGQYYDQLIVGYERRVGAAFKVGTHGTYRVLRWVLEDGVPPGDSVFRMGNPGRGPLATMPRARHEYAAFVLFAERSTPGPLYLLASYVLSRNVGNYTGLYASDFPFAWPNSGPQYDFPDLMTNAYGLLPNDRTHVVKVAASYRLAASVTLGGFLTVASGTPLNEYGTTAYGEPYKTLLHPRGSAGRTPTIWSLDLHGAYALPVARHGRVRPRLLLDVFNVGNPRKPLLYDQLHYLDNAQTDVNPNYGKVTRYQPPMSARMGVVVDF